MDVSSITATLAGLKSAGDIVKSIIELKSVSVIQTKIIDLQSQILTAQSSAFSANAEQATMVETIRTLKEEIARIKAWESEKQRYKMYSPWNGTVVYALKKSMCNSEPPHWICTNCYEEGRKSILAQQQKGNSTVAFLCPKCGALFQAIGRHKIGFLYPLKYV